MATFLVAAVGPLLPIPPSGAAPVKVIHQFFIADAANDQAAINLVASWDSFPADADYLAIPFNARRATAGGGA
jgi:hypothetical protein